MSKKEIKRLVILNIPYLILGLLATNLGEAWRLAEGIDISAKLLAFFSTVGQAFDNPMPSFYPSDLLVGLFAGGCVRLAVYLKGKNAKKYRQGVSIAGQYPRILSLTFRRPVWQGGLTSVNSSQRALLVWQREHRATSRFDLRNVRPAPLWTHQPASSRRRPWGLSGRGALNGRVQRPEGQAELLLLRCAQGDARGNTLRRPGHSREKLGPEAR